MRYIHEIRRGLREGRTLPQILTLLRQHRRWSSLKDSRSVFQIKLPWLTFSAIGWLQEYLRSDMKVFEYGGGGSTAYFSSRVAELVTVEHDAKWYDRLVTEMRNMPEVKWKGHFIRPEAIIDSRWNDISNPDHYISDDEQCRGLQFNRYASAIDGYPEEYFDVVLVDGRARPSCLMHAVSRIKKGGVIILDNAERPYYLGNVGHLLKAFDLKCNSFGPTPYSEWFTQTNIWVKTH